MSSNNKLQVTNLDFDGIKTSLINYMKTVTDENDQPVFTDYNFQASGLSAIMDLLAYNTHINALMANFIANEMFLDTAAKRSSVVSHAKSLGYTPKSVTSAKIPLYVSMTDPTVQGGTRPAQYVMPAGTTAISQVASSRLLFTTIANNVLSWNETTQTFEGTAVFYEGVMVQNTYTYNRADPYLKVPNAKVDTSTLRVWVKDDATVEYAEYQKVSNFLSISSDSQCFFVQESGSGGFEIYFGDGVFGYKPKTGASIKMQYVASNGSAGNDAVTLKVTSGLSSYITLSNMYDSNGYTIKASGGSDIETIDSIKRKTLNHYGMQNRAVIPTDYEALIIEANLGNVKNVRCWGGEDDSPPQYNRTVICVEPQYGDYITQVDRDLITTLLQPKAVGNMGFAFKNPEYIDLVISNVITYDALKISISTYELEAKVQQIITDYAASVATFDGVFRTSNLISLLDEADPAVISNNLTLQLSKFVRVTENVLTPITFSFNNQISLKYKGAAFQSTAFTIPEYSGNVKFQDDGLGSVQIVSGTGTVIVSKAGTIDYTSGDVSIDPLMISSMVLNQIQFTVYPDNTDVGTSRNYIVRLPSDQNVLSITSKAA